MFHNHKGFTLLETVAAITTLFISLIIIIPSFAVIQKERKQLYTQLELIDHLSMELNETNFHKRQLPFKFVDHDKGINVSYHFQIEDNLIKGCVLWKTIQKKEKSFCLYKQHD